MTHSQTPVRALGAVDADGLRVLSDVGSTYRDGAEEELLRVVSAAADLSSTSDELRAHARTWAETYHLSPARANVVRALDLPPGGRVLEIGAGCGAVTRYLGERCAVVDALEPVPARARVARARTRDLPGVEVVVGALDDVPAGPTYDVVVVVGVLEYVGGGTADLAPYREFLAGAQQRLLPGGSLVLAIENKLGVKYLAGAPEDHTQGVFDGPEDYPRGGWARTFTLAELTVMFDDVGLSCVPRMAFPDYKLPRVLLRPDLPPTARALAHRVPRFPSPDWLAKRPKLADERALWRTIVEAGVPEHFANSFVLIGRNGPGPELWPEELLAAWWTSERRAPLVTQTRVVGTPQGPVVRRSPLQPGGGRLGILTVRAWEEPLVDGADLLEVLATADSEATAALLADWQALLIDADEPGGARLDLVPHNLVQRPDGELVVIDDEWRWDDPRPVDVRARGVLWLGTLLAERTSPSRWPELTTVRDLVLELGTHVGLADDGEWLSDTLEQEARFQAALLPAPGGEEDEHLERLREGLARNLAKRLDDAALGRRAHERLTEAEHLVEELRREAGQLRATVGQLADRAQDAEEKLRQARLAAEQFHETRAGRLLLTYRRTLDASVPVGSHRRRVFARLTGSPATPPG